MRAIGKILETFFVNIVYHRQGDYTYLEVLGSPNNVEIAEYVAGVLVSELDKLWEQAKSQNRLLKGMIAKNSFYQGLAKGYCNKVKSFKHEFNPDISKALMIIEQKLADAKKMAYKHLISSRSSARHCQESSLLGELMGRQLTINPAVKSAKNSEALLTYQY